MDSPLTHMNAMAKAFPSKNNPIPFDPSIPIPHQYVRWELNPNSETDFVEPRLIANVNGEYPTVDPRVACREYTFVFMACFDPSVSDTKQMPFIYDSVSRTNVKTGKVEWWRAGDNIQVQEPVFIPRSNDCEEGDGYIIVFLSHFDTMLSSLAILDTDAIAAGPVARIMLPFRLKSGIHGSWVPVSDTTNGPLCDMSGIDDEIKEFVRDISGKSKVVEDKDKTADQDLPNDIPGIVNGPRGTAKWGIGKLHHGF